MLSTKGIRYLMNLYGHSLVLGNYLPNPAVIVIIQKCEQKTPRRVSHQPHLRIVFACILTMRGH